MTRLRSVLRDVCGLLADTETIHPRTWRLSLAARGGERSADGQADHWIRRRCGIAEFVRDSTSPRCSGAE